MCTNRTVVIDILVNIFFGFMWMKNVGKCILALHIQKIVQLLSHCNRKNDFFNFFSGVETVQPGIGDI